MKSKVKLDVQKYCKVKRHHWWAKVKQTKFASRSKLFVSLYVVIGPITIIYRAYNKWKDHKHVVLVNCRCSLVELFDE